MKKVDFSAKLARLEKQGEAVAALRLSVVDLEIRHEELRAENDRLDHVRAALALASAHYRELFDAAPFAYLVLNDVGAIEEVNSAGAALLGQDSPGLVGTLLAAWIHGGDAAKFFEHVRRCRRAEDVVRTEVRLRTSAGRIIPVELYSRPVLAGSSRYGTAITDVSERVRWERERREAEEERHRAAAHAQAVQEASKTKDRFFAVLSHELRTPLAPIVNVSMKLKQASHLPPEVRAAATMIHRNAELQTRLIDDLLDMTRSLEGKLHLHFERVDVHSVITDVADGLAQVAKGSHINVQLSLAAHRHFAHADRGRLYQVVSNLLRNAIEHSNDAAEIVVESLNPSADRIQVSIADDGVGIAAENLERIFDPFEQVNAPGERSAGLGLGLAIAKSLIGVMGGCIRAASEGPGKGARFTFDLETGEAPPLRPVAKASSDTRVRPGTRVLIVEDHVDTATSLAELLHVYGYETRLAHGVEAALEAASEDFDVVISDIALPDGSGLELMRKLHESHGLDGIALSGFGSEADVIAARRAGFKEHITKPADVHRLLAAIERVATQRTRERHACH